MIDKDAISKHMLYKLSNRLVKELAKGETLQDRRQTCCTALLPDFVAQSHQVRSIRLASPIFEGSPPTSNRIGLAFLVIPEAAALEAGAAAVAKVFLTSIQQAPTVAKALWPPGTIEEATYEYGKLSSQLTNVAGALGPRIEDALGLVLGINQTDTSTFLAFAGRGDFSKPRDQGVSVSIQTEHLLLAFTTFLVSQALVDQGWHAVIAIGVDPLGITNGTESPPGWRDGLVASFVWHDLNCHTYDNNSQCDNAWWYSEKQNSAYTLPKDPYYGFYRDPEDKTDPTNLIRTIFNNRGTTGSLLFESAGLCSLLAGIEYSKRSTDEGKQLFNDYHFSRDRLLDHTNPDEDSIFGDILVEHVHGVGHPNNTLFNLAGNMPDFSCTSQLNLTILKDWMSVWYLHRDLHT
ncbi:MAG: hypothetical protein M1836_001499 [Candelina mexicana]|nr:MAG: hypothetical protein M1836_001499 [Candelina mexicana]